MHLRWSRAALALSIVSAAAAFGVGAIGVGTAAAVTPCGSLLVTGVCPTPVGTLTSASPTDTGGSTAIKSSWTGIPNDGHIDSLAVTVTWVSTGGPAGVPQPDPPSFSGTLPCQSTTPSGGTQECDVAWPPALEASGYVLNGMYTVSVTATTCPNKPSPLLNCSATSRTASGTASVRNAPTAPPNVKATLSAPPSSTVTITWDPSPEPDVFAYSVRRSGLTDPIGGCQLYFAPADLKGLPVCPAAMTATDTTSGGGDFTYTVSAIRYGETYAFSHSVETPTATKKITVPGPPATTVPGGSPAPGGGFGVFNTPKVKPGAGLQVIKPASKGTLPGISVTTVDPGFSGTLPYGPTTPTTADPPVAAGPIVPGPKGKSSVGSIALVGAGVLVTVIAMHGLWLRSEVKRSGVLEALEPEL